MGAGSILKEGEDPAISAGQGDFPPLRQGWAAVAILLLLFVTSLLDRNIFNLLGEHIRHDLQLTDFQLSLLYGTAFALTYALGGLPLGWALDRFSRRTVIWSAVSIWSIGTLCCGLSRGFTQLFVARSLVGAGEAVMNPASQSILADTFPPARLAFPMSIYAIGAMLGMGLSLAVGGILTTFIDPAVFLGLPLFGQIRGWQLIFAIVGLPGLLIALAIFLIAEPPRHRPVGAAGTTGFGDYWRFARRNARFLVNLHVAGILVTIVVNSFFAWTPAYFLRVHAWTVDQTGLWLGAVMIAGPSIGVPLTGLIVNWLVQKGMVDAQLRYLIGALILAAPLLGIGYTIDNAWIALALIAIGQAAVLCYIALMPAALMSVVPSDMRGKAASIIQLITAMVGMVVGPTLIALLAEWLGGPGHVGGALALCAAVLLPVGALFYAFAVRPLRTALEAGSRV